MKRAVTQPGRQSRRCSASASRARALTRFTFGVSLCIAAILTACLAVQGVAAASPPKQYLLKHPSRQHCKAHYVKRSKTVKVKSHGRYQEGQRDVLRPRRELGRLRLAADTDSRPAAPGGSENGFLHAVEW